VSSRGRSQGSGAVSENSAFMATADESENDGASVGRHHGVGKGKVLVRVSTSELPNDIERIKRVTFAEPLVAGLIENSSSGL